MPSRHAEADAFNKLSKRSNLNIKAIDLFVIRLNSISQLGESRPCYHCLCMMEKCGYKINNVYYSTNEGIIMKEKFSGMKNSELTYVSSGIRTKNKQTQKITKTYKK